MASRNAGTSANEMGVELSNPTTVEWKDSGGGSSYSSGFEGIANQEALDILMNYIKETASGGTADRKAQRAERNKQILSTRETLGDYTKSAAFADAADLMAQNLRQSLEKNMPAISKSIQGAGTSASSMQGLLSQKLATESAQAAGALGAEQARAYGGISSQLQGVLESLTKIDPTLEQNLIQALGLTKTSQQGSSQVQNPTKVAAQSGGGTYYQPIEQPQQSSDSGGGGGYSNYYTPSSGSGQGYLVNNTTGAGTIFSNGGSEDIQINQGNSGGGDYGAANYDEYGYSSSDYSDYGTDLEQYFYE